MREQWLQAVSKALPTGAYPGVPLLGAEITESSFDPPPQPWRLRLALCQQWQPDQLAALTEDVQEIRLLSGAASQSALPGHLELYLEEEKAAGAWSVLAQEEANLGPLAGRRVTWVKGESKLVEQTVIVDSLLLRNLALLRSLSTDYPEVNRWAVTSAVSANGQAEGLVADTLAYWTGAVAGVPVLEVAQQPGEGFDTLWARLSICRLLRWEADLGQPGDTLSGAGLFDSLRN